MKRILAASLVFATVATAQSIPLPAFGSTFTSTLTRGYWFTNPSPCIIQGILVPNEALQPYQVAEVIDLAGAAPPNYPGTVTGTQLFYDNTTAGGSLIPTNIVLAANDVIGVLGACNSVQGGTTSYNSYGTPSGAFASSILGTPTTLTRFGTQSGIAANGGNQPCWQEPAGPVGRVELHIVPAAGLYANFTSDVNTGPSPLTVNFTDASFSSDPAGVAGWAWDFENDGTIDSTAQNPQHIYTACGVYDVSVTVFDASHPPSTATQTAFISTDVTTADFAESLIAPLVVQFTDTSVGSPTAWDWDLDGDGTTDSTQQNPAWVYVNANPVNITLTVGRLCGPTSTVTRSIVPLQQISTGVAANNANGNYGSVLFDLDVLNPTGITIESLDIHTTTVGAINLDMYVKPGTYTGSYLNANEWVLVGTATGTSAGGGYTVPDSVTFTSPVYLPQGLSGVKFHYRDFYCQYTTGTGVQAFGNGDVTMTAGTSQYTTTTNAFTGTTITPRWFAGSIYYSTHNLTGNADYGMFASGCPSSMGQSTLTASATPALGTSMTVDINNLPTNAALMMTGFSNTTSVLGALPFDLASFGAPGCSLRVSPDANSLLLGAGNMATWAFTIPNTPALASTKLFQQAVVLDPTANAAGASGSASAAMIIGL